MPGVDIKWDTNNSVVCFGTSLTYGFVWDNDGPVTPPEVSSFKEYNDLYSIYSYPLFYHQADSAYPHCLDNKLKLDVHNQGYVNATVERALDLVQDSILSNNPALVLLEFTANEFLLDHDVSTVDDCTANVRA